MKKLIAILAIVGLCTAFTNAEKVTNPFKFSFSEQLKIRHEEEWRYTQKQAWAAGNVGSNVGDNPNDGDKGNYAELENAVQVGASATFGQIYALSFTLNDALRTPDFRSNGSSQSLNRNALTFTWGNNVQIVKDYFLANVSLGWVMYADMDNNSRTQGGGDGNRMNLYGDFVKFYQNPTFNSIFYEVPMSLQFAGIVPKSGFSWSLNQNLTLELSPQFYKDNDPTWTGSSHRTGDGKNDPYTVATSSGLPVYNSEDEIKYGTAGNYGPQYATLTQSVTSGDVSFGNFLSNVETITRLNLNYEFFHFFAPENITCTLAIQHTLYVNMPVVYYMEYDKEIKNRFEPQVIFGLDNVQFGLGFSLIYNNYWNTSAPVNDTYGSPWTTASKSIQVGHYKTNPDGSISLECPPHSPNQERIGFTSTLKFGNSFFNFSLAYYGFFRDFLYDQSGSGLASADPQRFSQDFEMAAQIKL
jgi:hypothetical protein